MRSQTRYNQCVILALKPLQVISLMLAFSSPSALQGLFIHKIRIQHNRQFCWAGADLAQAKHHLSRKRANISGFRIVVQVEQGKVAHHRLCQQIILSSR